MERVEEEWNYERKTMLTESTHQKPNRQKQKQATIVRMHFWTFLGTIKNIWEKQLANSYPNLHWNTQRKMQRGTTEEASELNKLNIPWEKWTIWPRHTQMQDPGQWTLHLPGSVPWPTIWRLHPPWSIFASHCFLGFLEFSVKSNLFYFRPVT